MACCNHFGINIEFIYSLLIFLFCFLIYYKTKETYSLSQYEPLKYFRKAFLFFGIAYFIRFALYFILIYDLPTICPKKIVFPIVITLVAFFSTLAIFYVGYSILWRKIKSKYIFIIIINILVILLGISSFFLSSLHFIAVFQIIIVITLLIYLLNVNKKFSQIKLLYALMLSFWVINLITLNFRKLVPFEIRTVFYIISLIVIATIYFKISKWLK